MEHKQSQSAFDMVTRSKVIDSTANIETTNPQPPPVAMAPHETEIFDLSLSPQDKAESEPKRRACSRQPPGSRSSSAGGVKRAAESEGHGRGRSASPWADVKRAVHRRIDMPSDASVNNSLESITSQLEADREHMKMLKDAIEHIYLNMRTMESTTAGMQQRFDEAIKPNANLLNGRISDIEASITTLNDGYLKITTNFNESVHLAIDTKIKGIEENNERMKAMIHEYALRE